MKKSTLYSLLAILLLTLALTAGCGGETKKPAQAPAKPAGPSGKLMIYTSMFPDIIEAVKPELKKAFPNLDVQWFQAGSEQVMTKLAGEIEAKKNPVRRADGFRPGVLHHLEGKKSVTEI